MKEKLHYVLKSAPYLVLALFLFLTAPAALCQRDAQADWFEAQAKAQQFLDSGHYNQAYKYFKNALELIGKAEPESMHHAESLSGMSSTLYNLGSYEEAAPLAEHALSIGEKLLPSGDHELAEEVNNLADIYQAQNKNQDAAPLYQRALAILEKRTGKDDPLYRRVLISSGANLLFSGKYTDAEPSLKNALDLSAKAHDGFNQALALGNLASLYSAQDRLPEAQDAAERALDIASKEAGSNQASLLPFINGLANVLGLEGKTQEANKLWERSNKIEVALGMRHNSKKVTPGLNVGPQNKQAQSALPGEKTDNPGKPVK